MEATSRHITTVITWDRETMRAGREVMESLRGSAAWAAYLEAFGEAPAYRLMWIQVERYRVLVGIDGSERVLDPPHQSGRRRARLWLARPCRPAR